MKVNMINLVKALFILLLVILPLGEVARFTLLPNISIVVNDIAVFLVVFVWLLDTITHKKYKEIILDTLFKPLSIFIGIGVLSLVINSTQLKSNELLVASSYLFRWIGYTALYFIVKSFDERFKQKSIGILIVVSSIVVGIGYVQYFFYPSLRNLYYLGWDEHLYRMFSSFLDPNFAGTFFVLFTVFLAGLLFNKTLKKWGKVFISILFFFSFVAIFLTYSRSALLMLVASGISFFVLMQRKNIIMNQKLIGSIIGFLLVCTAFIIFSPKSFQTEGTNLFRVASSFSRVESLQHGVKIFTDHPLLGIGFNAYRYSQERYGFIQEHTQFEDHSGAGTDNSFLFILATTGIVGFSAYLYLWYGIIMTAYHNSQAKTQEYILNIVMLASLIGLFVNSLFINSLFYPFVMEWMWIVIGLKTKKS